MIDGKLNFDRKLRYSFLEKGDEDASNHILQSFLVDIFKDRVFCKMTTVIFQVLDAHTNLQWNVDRLTLAADF